MQFADHFLQSLPAGTDPADVRVIKCAATVSPIESLDELEQEERVVLAEFNKAEPDPISPSGKPTVMRVMAWMVHEGINRNWQGFVKEELEEVAKSLFKAPNFGVMDFNHSAVLPWSDEPKVIGLWYKADFAFDEKAGKWGILATGMMWSWLFPEHADLLLAEQTRKAKLSFSMAAIPSSIEFGHDADGHPTEILHNPVFFTVSALDVPPADPDAIGIGTEDEDEEDDSIRQRLLQLAHWTRNNQQGEPMKTNEEIIQQLTEDREKAEQAAKDLAASYTTEKEAVAKELEETKAALEAATTKIAELETVRDALAAEQEKAVATLTELTAEVEMLRAFKAELETKEAEAAAAAKLAQRIAELPDSVRLIHAGRDEETKSRVEAKWIGMTDEQWTGYVKDELLPFATSSLKVSFFDRSQNRLPNIASDSADDIGTRVQSLLRNPS